MHMHYHCLTHTLAHTLKHSHIGSGSLLERIHFHVGEHPRFWYLNFERNKMFVYDKCLVGSDGHSFLSYVSPSEEVGICWFTSVRSVCQLSLCMAFFSVTVTKRLYVLTCKSSIYFLFADVTVLTFACHSPSKSRYKHTCEISRYFWFTVCSSACHSPSKRR